MGIVCSNCGSSLNMYKKHVPTVDILIVYEQGIVLIERKNPPFGWALPGGFVDYGESVEQAAVREAKEETGLVVELVSLLGVYSDPARDSRQHTISTVFVACPHNPQILPQSGDDARQARIFSFDNFPESLAFDHGKMVQDYLARL